MRLISRVFKRIKTTVQKFVSDCHFSFKYACLRVVDEIGGRIGFKKIAANAHMARESWAYAYLKEKLSSVIENYKSLNNESCFDENSPIWVCWWTGIEDAPEIVKQCICSTIKRSGRKVVVINKDNYSQYVNVPDYMLNKVNQGQIGLAHLCDYIRIALISAYGGLWLDATIFCSREVPMEYFKLPFFTAKSEIWEECPYRSKLRWVTFILGGHKNCIFYNCIKAILEEYWKKEKCAIDYLFFDYLIEIAYNEIPVIKQLIDNVPNNNPHRDDLQMAMNLALPAEEFDNIIDKETVLYKLSWRETYSLTTSDGQESIYAHFLNKDFA